MIAATIFIPAVCLLCFLILSWIISDQISDAEFVRRWSQFPLRLLHAASTTRFVLNLNFALDVVSVIQEQYQKFKHTTFHLTRYDRDLTLLPVSVLEELASLPASIASPHDALEHDLLGHYTGLDFILESRLHHKILQRRLTPRLPLVVSGIEEELNYSFDRAFPKSEEWTEFMPYQKFAQVSASLSARTLVGAEFCRDPVWLDISINYTENLFRTIVILRFFPPWIHGLLSRFLPSYWAGRRYIQAAKGLLAPRFEELISQVDANKWQSSSDDLSDPNVLTWLAEQAKGGDRNAETLSKVEVILALASVHTILLRMVNVLYDFAAHPTLVAELKEEIECVKKSSEGWNKTSYTQLSKLDSAMRESQRMSPPTVLGMKRMFNTAHTFSNGIHVPKGAYVCLPIHAIENDPSNTDDPDTFDGLRAYKRRQLVLAQSDSELRSIKQQNVFVNDDPYQFSSIDKTTLNFGYGKTACPGRHFASLVIKVFFVKFLTEYDFKFLPGEKRPTNITAHEFLFCWPWHKMMIKKKLKGDCPF